MGAVAARLSDLVVVTSDNPRSEDPNRIIDEIRLGITSTTVAGTAPSHLGIADRGAAIARAIHEAEPGDVVVIAGKGHEAWQVVGTERRPFDDRLVARAVLARRRAKTRVS
jgi:UDP-N-acetylmuramoyl-L-alanyl-D-glutamate--2,6-diaminopimelate ligase